MYVYIYIGENWKSMNSITMIILKLDAKKR